MCHDFDKHQIRGMLVYNNLKNRINLYLVFLIKQKAWHHYESNTNIR